MKILLLTSSYPRFEGDIAGAFIRDLCAKLAPQGFSFTVVAPGDRLSRRLPPEPGITAAPFTYCLPRRLQRLAYGAGIEENLRLHPLRRLLLPPFAFSFLAAALRAARRCDLVWSHWLLPAGLVGATAARLLGKPHLVTAHSAPPGMALRLLRGAFGGEATIAAVSAEIRTRLAGALGRAPGGVALAPMGVRAEFFAPRGPRAALRRRCGIGDEFTVLFVGRFVWIKGLDLLVRALEGLPGTLLVAAGDGPCRREIERRARELGVNARFEGIVRGARMLDLLATCDIVAAPSRVCAGGRAEGTPVGVLEALAAGAPVVAAASGGLAEVVVDGVNGLLVPPGDAGALRGAIARLREDRARRDRLSEGARLSARPYALDSVADRYTRLLRECLRPKRSTR